MKYVVYDGILRLKESFYIRSSNRAFRYGDGLFETIHYHKGRLLFWQQHYERMSKGMAVLNFSRNNFPTQQILESQILDLLVKNRIFNDGRVRITIFRRGEGLYTPTNLSASWLIEVEPLETKGYPWYEEGLHLGFYKGFPRHFTPLSPFKTIGSHINILAGIFADQSGLNEALIQSNEGRYIESISSNVFWVKDKILFTSSIATGCVDGIMRQNVIKIANKLNITVVENKGATEQELLNSEEIFLTNVISGIRWVVALNTKRYYAKMVKLIHNALLEEIKIS